MKTVMGMLNVSLFFALAVLFTSLCMAAFSRVDRPLERLHWKGTSRVVTSSDYGEPTSDKERWHLFLSHSWSDTQLQAHELSRGLVDMMPGLRCFLDIRDLFDIERLEDYVRQSRAFILFLSPSYLTSIVSSPSPPHLCPSLDSIGHCDSTRHLAFAPLPTTPAPHRDLLSSVACASVPPSVECASSDRGHPLIRSLPLFARVELYA